MAKRVAIVGAGFSGLVSTKECLAEGFEPICFEARDKAGGLWAYQADTSAPVPSSLYAGIVLNSSRIATSFSDFPLDPARYGDYTGHRQFLQYLHEYADYFGLTKYIRLRTRVLKCEPQDDGSWTLHIQTDGQAPETCSFDALIVAGGHQSTPHMPEIPGRDSFKGQILHSHKYRTPGPFEGKRVAVIGFGNSAVDIASEIGPQAQEMHLITRRGGWVLPRYVLGKPLEAWDNRATQLWLPLVVSQWLQAKLLALVDGKPPAVIVPDHKILEQNPIIHDDFMNKVRSGTIKVHRGTVTALNETGLTISGGTSLTVDVVIYATGYETFDMPYLPADVLRSATTPPGEADLFRRIHPLQHHNIFLLGYVDPQGALLPVVEAQARYTVALLAGRTSLPSAEAMASDVAASRKWQDEHFVSSERHNLTQHHIPYIDSLLQHIGAVPTIPRLLSEVFTSNPLRALSVLNTVWFGLAGSAQWRLFGYGAKQELARETLLRNSANGEQLSKREVELLSEGGKSLFHSA